MSFILVDTGKINETDYILGNGTNAWNGAKIFLYTNNHTPAHGDTPSAYTKATWTGIGTPSLSGFPASTLDGSNRAKSTANPAIFGNTSGSGQVCYGYYIVDSTEAILLGAEKFAGAPITIPDSFSFAVTFTFTQTSEF